jgi:hypothetical protein
MADEERAEGTPSGAGSGDQGTEERPRSGGDAAAGGAGGRAQGAGGTPDAPAPAGGAEAGQDDPAAGQSAHDAGGPGAGGPPS